MHQNQEFMEFLAQRSRSTKRLCLEDAGKRLGIRSSLQCKCEEVRDINPVQDLVWSPETGFFPKSSSPPESWVKNPVSSIEARPGLTMQPKTI